MNKTNLTLIPFILLGMLFGALETFPANPLTGYPIRQQSGSEGPFTPDAGKNNIFLPIIASEYSIQYISAFGSLRVNAPYFSGEIPFRETAIFWFGRITPIENYADVRVAYNNSEMYVHVNIFDHNLWYDKTPEPDDLAAWDAVSLYLDVDGPNGKTPDGGSHRFVGQLSWSEGRAEYQTAYRGQDSGFVAADTGFTTDRVWRGNAPNDVNPNDKGWSLAYHIPFSSLGLDGPPGEGSIWGLGVVVHDRDDQAGAPIADKSWPIGMKTGKPGTWGQLHFGLPTYQPPAAETGGSLLIRNKLDSKKVVDGKVGGGATCGKGLDYWMEWGDTSTPGSEKNADFNVQNQSDLADWPCFSKVYTTFPLDALPAGKVIQSATLTLHQFGNSGGGDYDPPQSSLIQIFTAAGLWDEASLTWNNAPLALENISRAWVDPIVSWPGWPGVAWTWDVSQAVAQAYATGQPLRLVIYSADGPRHSGKYFVSSDTPDWNAAARPALEVTWGNP